MATETRYRNDASAMRPDWEHDDRGNTWVARIRRVSWGGILAGLLAAVSLQMLLSVLGLAVGFWSIEPASEAEPLSGIGTGAGIWWLVTGILSMLAGGWVAGRMAGFPNPLDGLLHGFTTWGLVTVLSFWVAGTTLGTVLSATANAVGSAVSAAGEVVTGDQQAAGGGMAMPDVNYEAVGNRLADLLRDTETEQLKPENIEQAARQVNSTAEDAAVQALKRPETGRQQLDRVMEAFFDQFRDVRQAADQEALVNVITANSKISEQDARQIVNRWQTEYQQAKEQLRSQLPEDVDVSEMKAEAKQEARELGQDARQAAGEVTDAVASASMWAFGAMLAGLVAAMAGGLIGSPRGPITRHDGDSD